MLLCRAWERFHLRCGLMQLNVLFVDILRLNVLIRIVLRLEKQRLNCFRLGNEERPELTLLVAFVRPRDFPETQAPQAFDNQIERHIPLRRFDFLPIRA